MRRAALATLVLALGCASAPVPEPDTAIVWGYVRLVPKAGAGQAGDAYGDRRVRKAEQTDYSQPGYAVTYLDSRAAPPPPTLALSIEPGARSDEFRPALAAAAAGLPIAISNHTQRVQIASAPMEGWLAEIAPGETAVITPQASGELAVHLLGAQAAPALVWVAPGAFAVAGTSGRYELHGLEPGNVAVRAWHPRLPPSAPEVVTLARGAVHRLDIEIGVDHGETTR